MRFNICLIYEKDCRKSLDDVMEQFYVERQVEPYTKRISDQEIQLMADWFNIDPEDTEALAKKLPEWDNYESGHVDKDGLYGVSTQNPNGRLENWTILDRIATDQIEEAFFADGYTIAAIATSDGDWIEGPIIFGSGNDAQKKEFENWDKTTKKIISERKNVSLWLVRCKR